MSAEAPFPLEIELTLTGLNNAARLAERKAILNVLEATRWNKSQAAKLLKISYKALLYKIKDCGIEPPP